MNKPSKNKSDDSKEKVRPSSSKSSSSSNKNDPAGLFNFRKVKTAVVLVNRRKLSASCDFNVRFATDNHLFRILISFF